MSISSHLECLPNELFDDIFDYLTVNDIIRCFNRLNQRFTRLLAEHSFHIDMSHLSKEQFDRVCRLVPFEQIHSLKLSQKSTINIVARLSFHSMVHLRTLILSHINSSQIRVLFQSDTFTTIQQLTTLKIQSSNVDALDRERLFILKKIFGNMPLLRVCQVPLIDVNDFDDLNVLSTIEQFTVDYCTIIGLGK
jgi:hypothetical protein